MLCWRTRVVGCIAEDSTSRRDLVSRRAQHSRTSNKVSEKIQLAYYILFNSYQANPDDWDEVQYDLLVLHMVSEKIWRNAMNETIMLQTLWIVEAVPFSEERLLELNHTITKRLVSLLFEKHCGLDVSSKHLLILVVDQFLKICRCVRLLKDLVVCCTADEFWFRISPLVIST